MIVHYPCMLLRTLRYNKPFGATCVLHLPCLNKGGSATLYEISSCYTFHVLQPSSLCCALLEFRMTSHPFTRPSPKIFSMFSWILPRGYVPVRPDCVLCKFGSFRGEVSSIAKVDLRCSVGLSYYPYFPSTSFVPLHTTPVGIRRDTKRQR